LTAWPQCSNICSIITLNKEGALFIKSGIDPLFFRAMEIIEKVKALLEPIASERGYSILDITCKREGGGFALRIALDKPGGITMDECARFNTELGELLDKENIVEEGYLLEVSSPGLDRKLKKDSDFIWAVGKKVRISTFGPFEGKNVFSGTLTGLGEGTVVVNEGKVSVEIPRSLISKAQVEPDVDLEQSR